jgi:type II secretory pathway predicted ATPase ExeA
MYTEFYNLKEKPFNLTPSSRFLYLGESHGEALNMLKYGVMERKGFILLTGEIGTGKTTLIQALMRTLDDSVHCIHLSNPLLSPGEFMDYLAFSAFKKKVHFRSKADFLVEFEEFLGECLRNQTNVILIIDEAQKLSFEVLEEIRLLSNMETGDEKLINIFLVGQPELNEKLGQPQCMALLQRISMRYHIKPLDLEETRDYVTTRLRVAGAPKGDEVFSKSAVRAIHQYAHGYPRVINILADNALLLGYSRATKPITPTMVQKCYEDMSLESSLPKDRQAIAGPHEPEKRELTRGSFWMWAVALCFIGALVAFAMTQTGRSRLWQLFGLKPPSQKISPSEVVVGKVPAEVGEHVETGVSAPADQTDEYALPTVETEAQGAQSTEIEEPGMPAEHIIPLREEQRGFYADLTVQEGAICRDVYSRRPVASGTNFKASVGKLYCFTKVVGAQTISEITHVWYFGNSQVAGVKLPVKSFSWRTYSSKTIRAQDIGDWHVDVLDPRGNVLWSVEFKITQ